MSAGDSVLKLKERANVEFRAGMYKTAIQVRNHSTLAPLALCLLTVP